MEELRATIDAAGDPAVAATLARYFQTGPGGYGEGDVFVGVRLSVLRRLTRPHVRRPFVAEEWRDLLTSPVHEHRLAALVVMSRRFDRAEESEREAIYRTYRDHTDQVDNWDLVDVSAAAVVGGYLQHRDRSPLEQLARSATVWERRIAVIATHKFLRDRCSADTYAVATVLLGDGHDLIHKAVGWSLREAGVRVDVDELRTYLHAWALQLPRTTLRYAIERFDPDERRRFLALGRS